MFKSLINTVRSAAQRSLRSNWNCWSANDEEFECIMNPRQKCALVTEGSTGVGYVIAQELLKKFVSTVIITGKDKLHGHEVASHLSRQYCPGLVRFHEMPNSSPMAYENTFKYIRENFATVDIFINNAPNNEGVEDMIDTHMSSQIQGLMLAVTHMKPGSVIINHASALGLGYVPVERTQIVHSAAAMGLIAASRAFSDDVHYNQNKIRVITLCSDSALPVPSVRADVAAAAVSERPGTEVVDGGKIAIEFHWIKLSLFLVSKLAISSAFSIFYLLTAEIFHTQLRSTMVSMCSMIGRIGSMLAITV